MTFEVLVNFCMTFQYVFLDKMSKLAFNYITVSNFNFTEAFIS